MNGNSLVYAVAGGSEATSTRPGLLPQGTRAIDWIGERLAELNRALMAGLAPLVVVGEAAHDTGLEDCWSGQADFVQNEVIDKAHGLSTRATVETAPWHGYVQTRLVEMMFEGLMHEDYPASALVVRAWSEVNSVFGHHTPTPSVVPSEDGGIAFVWHKNGWDVELDVDPTETTVWAQRRDDGTNLYGPLATQRGRLVEMLSEMASA
jgi:hypothetical protein